MVCSSPSPHPLSPRCYRCELEDRQMTPVCKPRGKYCSAPWKSGRNTRTSRDRGDPPTSWGAGSPTTCEQLQEIGRLEARGYNSNINEVLTLSRRHPSVISHAIPSGMTMNAAYVGAVSTDMWKRRGRPRHDSICGLMAQFLNACSMIEMRQRDFFIKLEDDGRTLPPSRPFMSGSGSRQI